MKNVRLWLLGGLVAACSQQAGQPSEAELNHQYDNAYQQQVALLQADEVKLTATRTVQNGAAISMLNVLVVNPKKQPPAADTLRQRLRKLAHLAVANLAHPDGFKVVSVQATFKQGRFLASSSSSQTFIYPLATLK